MRILKTIALFLLLSLPLRAQQGNQVIPTASSSSSAATTAQFGVVFASDYGVKPIKYITDATLSTANAIIDCTFSNDCFFVAGTDNGSVCWATNAQTDLSQTALVVLPEGTLTVTDAQHATCSGGNATANQAHNAIFLWGPLSSATSVQTQSIANDPLFAAWTAASNSCSKLVLPGYAMFVEQPEFITWPTNPRCGQQVSIEYVRVGFSLAGQGRTSTILIPTPSFPPANCTGPNGAGTACFMSFPNPVISDLQIWGAGNNFCGAGFNGKILVDILGSDFGGGSNGLLRSVFLQSWCGSQAGTIGMSLGGGHSFSGIDLHDTWSEYFACEPVDILGAAIVNWYGGDFWGGCTTPALMFDTASVLKTYGTIDGYTSNSSGGIVRMFAGSTWYSTGDYLFNSGTSAQTIRLDAGTIYLDGTNINLTSAGAYALYSFTGTGTVHMHNYSVTGTVTANHSFFSDTGATINAFDDCGNVIPTGTATGAGTFNLFGSCSSTGALQVAANITPTTGFGTGCATAGQCVSAVTGNSLISQFTMTYGTGPASPQTLTIVFPTVVNFGTKSPFCRLTDVGGTNAFPTSVTTVSCTTTGASFSIVNTPVGGSTDIFQLNVGN